MAEGELEILPSPGLQQNDAQRPTQGQIQIHILIHLSQNVGTDKYMNYLRDILKKTPSTEGCRNTSPKSIILA